MATKKSGGSSRNGRDSAGRRLGIKRNAFVCAGDIIIRQRGTTYYPGENVGVGKDHTLYSLTQGHLYFTSNNHTRKKYVHVYDLNHLCYKHTKDAYLSQLIN